MAASLAALPGNEVLFASEYGRRDFSLPGVKRVLLKKPKDRKKAVASISTAGEMPFPTPAGTDSFWAALPTS